MFRTVIIDSPTTFSESEARLVSFFYLLADEVIDAYDVFMNRGNWIDEEKRLYTTAYGTVWYPEPNKPIKLQINDELVYEPWSLYEPGWGMSSGSQFEVGEEFVYSKKKWIKDVAIYKRGISAQTSILVLAAAGIEFALPGFDVQYYREEELERIKEKLAEERENYLLAVSGIAREAYERLQAGVYSDTVDWARNESEFTLNRSAMVLDRSLSKLDQKLLKRLGIGFIKEGLTETAKALASDGISGATKTFIIEVLKVLTKTLSQQLEHRNAPEASYGIRLRSELQRINKHHSL